ncbi:hypothetical protein AB0H83_31810 [Dactylosporangium sp. NPDC050688]|uniref:hypothetical protein n=1 Tax=Dactylosporangium sp. NPDC050688 TaxID=3157217 RepID=UPI0033C4EABF
MSTRQLDHDQLQLLLGICYDFFRHTGPAARSEVDARLRERDITGGPGWLIDMLGLTHQRLQDHTQAHNSEPCIRHA